MYEEYLEDYVYKLMAKAASRLCKLFKKEQKIKSSNEISVEPTVSSADSQEIQKAITYNKDESDSKDVNEDANKEIKESGENEKSNIENEKINTENETSNLENESHKCNSDDDLNNINFHMTLFFLWMCVTIVNIPALLTWARNYKYSAILKPDTSYHTGMIMSACSGIIWQIEGPRKKLRYYEAVGSLLFTMAVFIIALGPFSLTIVNYGIAFMFAVITVQQLCDREEKDASQKTEESTNMSDNIQETVSETKVNGDKPKTKESDAEISSNSNENNSSTSNNQSQNTKETLDDNTTQLEDSCDVCSENRFYNMMKRLRDKLSFSND